MSIVLLGSTSGSCTLQEEAIAGTTTLTLPTTSGTILTTGSSGGVIPKAALPAGSVLQVVSTAFNPGLTTTTSTSYVNSGLSLGITLSSASNRVLMLYNGGHAYSDSFPNGMIETICRQSSTTYSSGNDLSGATGFGMTQIYNSTNINTAPHSINYLDTTPGSTTPTYRIFFRSRSGGVVVWQEGASQVSLTLLEIAA
jgi:hypothetical protein